MGGPTLCFLCAPSLPLSYCFSLPILIFPARYLPPHIRIFKSHLFFLSAEITPPLPSSEQGRCFDQFVDLSVKCVKCENQELWAQLRSVWTSYAPCAQDKERTSRVSATWAQKYETLWEISSVTTVMTVEKLSPPPSTPPFALGYQNYVSCFEQDKGSNGKAGVPKQETGIRRAAGRTLSFFLVFSSFFTYSIDRAIDSTHSILWIKAVILERLPSQSCRIVKGFGSPHPLR
jgi:hypothetical protein